MGELFYKEESYKIIGCCIEVHKELGPGFLEVVYKDALEVEFQLNDIPYSREKSFEIIYKGTTLNRKYNADFVIYDKIILEVKAFKRLCDENLLQTLNYLKVTKFKLGILANFGESSFNSKRVIF
ncbi:MAG: GTP-binding signal recognition particle [Chlorobi bacterium OLB5]|nr:MAG: GTP-binding signal recognition particle [Chlorobi bacterium OLB5]